MNQQMMILMLGLEITEIMARNQIMERASEAQSDEEKTAVVAESVELVREFAEKLFKDTEAAQVAKEKFMTEFTAFQYEHFGLPVPI